MPFPLAFAIKLIPLYCNIMLGFIAGKKLQASQETISRLMFYLISPLIVFNGVRHTPLKAHVMTLPVLTFAIASILCCVFYRYSRGIWQDASRNILAFSAGSGATGYFGLPIAMLLFSREAEGVYIMALLGVTLYDNSVGYYFSMKHSHTPSECMKKVIRLPTLYAFAAAMVANLLHVPMPEVYYDFIQPIKGVYVVLGMMIIGIGLSSLKQFTLDLKFVGLSFFAKFLIWPVIILTIIAIDQATIGLYDLTAQRALILLSIVPLAVNTVVIASLTKCHPEKTAATVLLSALFALIYVPIMTHLCQLCGQ